MPSIFSVSNSEFRSLDGNTSTRFFQDLLWAEASRLGIPPNKITVSLQTNVADGGIDATVDDTEIEFTEGLIKKGGTSYQIKASTTLNIYQKSSVEKELFGDKEIGRENLGSEVVRCLEEDRTYILANFGQDLNPNQKTLAEQHFREFFSECGYPDAKVEVWGQTHIAGFTNAYPSLALQLPGRGRVPFHTHSTWSSQDQMRSQFVSGEEQVIIVEELRNELLSSERSPLIRILGEPGIGKTRTALEATSPDHISPLVLYTNADDFIRSELWYQLLNDEQDESVILVIDECNEGARADIWNNFKHVRNIKIIALGHESEIPTGPTTFIEMQPLEEEQILQIFEQYGIKKGEARRWATFCDGSPRVAHILGENLRTNPDDLLKEPDSVQVWDRFVAGRDDLTSQEFQEIQTVLQHIALFKKFGLGDRVKDEAIFIAGIIEKADPNITWSRFLKIIHELRERRIFQGETTLYITPRLLHIKLWRDWWNIYGEAFNLDSFIEGMPRTLLDWFFDMFKYAAESEAAKNTVSKLLGKGGPFLKHDLLQTRLGARFFLFLAEGSPKAALEFLEDYFSDSTKVELLEFQTARRNVVFALEGIAVWRELFPGAAKILLRLGEAENEIYGNNASGVFADLFSSAPGQLAPTEATPDERFPILKEALESASKEKRMLGIEACNRGLRTGYFSRTIGPEYQGLRKTPNLWTPKMWGEFFDAIENIWELLWKTLPNLEDDEQDKAINVLLNNSRGILRKERLGDQVLTAFEELISDPYFRRKQVHKNILDILKYDRDKLPDETIKRLETIQQSLEGPDFSSRLHRWIGLNIYEDQYDDEGNRTGKLEKTIHDLAVEAIQIPDQLIPEINWLISDEPANGYFFGYELGKADETQQYIDHILEKLKEGEVNFNILFPAGYLRAIREKDEASWEGYLDKIESDPILVKLLPEITWRSGITDKSVLRLLSLAKNGIVELHQFGWMGFGQNANQISHEVFLEIIDYLLLQKENIAVSIALEAVDRIYLSKDNQKQIPEELGIRSLLHEALFEESETQRNTMDNYHWERIARVYLQEYPHRSLQIGEMMLANFGKHGSIVAYFGDRPTSILNDIGRNDPEGLWNLIAPHIELPFNSASFWILDWLRGYEETFGSEPEVGAFSMVPSEAIWNWIEEDLDSRAPLIAQYISKDLHLEGDQVSLAREVLVRFGEIDGVGRALKANYSTASWTGSRSSYLIPKINGLNAILEKEDHPSVTGWIKGYVRVLEEELEEAKVEEERRGY